MSGPGWCSALSNRECQGYHADLAGPEPHTLWREQSSAQADNCHYFQDRWLCHWINDSTWATVLLPPILPSKLISLNCHFVFWPWTLVSPFSLWSKLLPVLSEMTESSFLAHPGYPTPFHLSPYMCSLLWSSSCYSTLKWLQCSSWTPPLTTLDSQLVNMDCSFSLWMVFNSGHPLNPTGSAVNQALITSCSQGPLGLPSLPWLHYLLQGSKISLPDLRLIGLSCPWSPTCMIKFELLSMTNSFLYNQFPCLPLPPFHFRTPTWTHAPDTKLPPTACATLSCLPPLQGQIKSIPSALRVLLWYSQGCWLCHSSRVKSYLLIFSSHKHRHWRFL